jgi:hypothetical protein
MRLSQYRELLWREWQKSPENPFNQDTTAYNEGRRTAAPDKDATSSSKLPNLSEQQLEEMTKKDIVELMQVIHPVCIDSVLALNPQSMAFFVLVNM